MIITFAHYKGGTGKTTSCLSIAGYLAKSGKKILVVDLDPQGNATSGLGIDKRTLVNSMYRVMKNKKTKIKDIILKTNIRNLHLAPADHTLDMINLRSYKKKSDATHLKDALKNIKDYYDYILIDTPPVHSHFIINGMVAADSVILVLDPGIFALEGVKVLKDSFGNFLAKLGLDLNIEMALVTKTQGFSLFRKNQAKEIQKETEKLLEKNVFLIPYSNYIYGTHAKGVPISHYQPWSKAGRAYKKIVKEILLNEKIRMKLDKKIGTFDKQGKIPLRK
ncbi:AAA family ATPase [Candidatus Pacearchaeota archaeon]|nr:AAA family ATPase [Candidatus Pacearchaeota archaeon]